MLPLMAVAAERSAAEAAQLAADFVNEQFSLAPGRKAEGNSSFILSHTRTKWNSEAPAFYVFNSTSNDGFVVVSGDDRCEDVLMYSCEGNLDVENANPNLKFWLNYLQEVITKLQDGYAVSKQATTVSKIEPLLKNKGGKLITWAQDAPYNIQCPMDQIDTTSRCLTGCVATAMAQVMYMWRYPEKGTGSHTYTWSQCVKYVGDNCTDYKSKILSKDFSSVTFDWDNMLPAYYGYLTSPTQNKAVAELMSCCGIACDMMYGADASGSFNDWMAAGAEKYFGYTFDKFLTQYPRYQTAVASNRCKFSTPVDTFVYYFNKDLEAGRPILVSGVDAQQGGGHEFVCDGRDSNGKFHINWGWEGQGNCYCTLTALVPSGSTYDFSTYVDAVIGLRPNLIDTIHVTGVSIVPDKDTLKINQKDTLKAIVMPVDATTKSVVWSSNDPAIAFVSSDGVVRGMSQGTTTITATTQDGNKTAQATIVVTDEIIPLPIFKWLIDASELAAGDDVILVADYDNVLYAMDKLIHTTKTTYYFSTEIQHMEEDSTILLDEVSQTAILTLGGSKGKWTLSEPTYGQLGAASAKKLTWNDGTMTWSIAIDKQGVATIQNTTDKYGMILYNDNSGSPRYSTYTSISDGYVAPMLFVRKKLYPTELEEVQSVGRTMHNTMKILKGGKLYIVRGEHIYTLQGQEIK